MSVLRKYPASQGFTLIEVLIALSLLAIMATLLFSTVQMAFRSSEAGEARADATAENRSIGEFLRTTFQQARIVRLRKVAERAVLFRGEANRVVLAAPLPVRINSGGIYLLELTVDGDQRSGKRLLLRRMMIDPDWDRLPDFNDAETTVLVEGVTDFKVRYFGREREDTQPAWADRWEYTQRIPQLVTIAIATKQGTWPELALPLRVGLENGCQWDDEKTKCI